MSSLEVADTVHGSSVMHLNRISLSFNGPDLHLEDPFLEHYRTSSLSHIRFAMIMAALLVAAFGVLDYYLLPTLKHFTWFIRFAIICPGALLTTALTYYRPAVRYLPALQSSMLVVTGSGFTAMIFYAGAPVNYLYYTGLIQTLFYGYTFLRLRFVHASISAWLFVVIYEVVAVGYTDSSSMILLNNAFFLISSNIIGMMANYSIEYYARRDFFMLHRLSVEQGKVQAANARLEERVRDRTEDLERLNSALREEVSVRTEAESSMKESVREKEILLKEIHHRVKNNMQVISSLLNLQANAQRDEAVRNLFTESQLRVRSMAMVHEQLYQSGNLGNIRFSEYARTLTALVSRSFRIPGVSVEVEESDVSLGIDIAIPCGLILNELLTNSLKHGFRGRESGRIVISMVRDADARAILCVGDDGIGLSSDISITELTSMGMTLITNLAKQIDGTVEFEGRNGVRCCVVFPLPLDRSVAGTA